MVRLLRPSTPSQTLITPAVEHRSQFHHDLDALEEQMRTMAILARASLESSVRALLSSDVGLCEQVIAEDDRVDAAYQQIEGPRR